MTSTFIHQVKEIKITEDRSTGTLDYFTKTIKVIGENGETLNEIVLFGDNKIKTKEEE
jgi:hypothetical protein